MLHSLWVRLLLTMTVVVVVAVGTVAVFTSRTTTNEFQRYVEDDIANNQQIVTQVMLAYEKDKSLEGLQPLVEELAQSSGQRLIVAARGGEIVVDSGKELIGQDMRMAFPMPPGFTQGIAFAAGPGPGVEVGLPLEPGVAVPFTPGLGMPLGAAMPMTAPMPFSIEVSSPISSIAFRGLAGGEGDMLTWGPPVVPIARVYDGMPGAEGGGFVVARVRDAQSGERGFLNSVNRSLLLAVATAGVAALLLTLLLSRRIVGPVEALTAAARKMERGDLSQRVEVKAKDEIGELAHAFNAMAGGLERQEELRRNMVTDVAHELRTPLSNIRGYLEALRDGVARPDRATIESLHEEAMLLSRLVDDLQELELAEAGQLKLVPREVAIGEIIERAVAALRPLVEEKGVQIEVASPPDLPTVEADAERIGQVLRNLLTNALTHTPPGGRISVAARLDGDEVEVGVRDTGEGIAPEHLPHIFDRFYRADQSRARATGGAGLGLAIVRQLVELHGGNVWAESVPGEGAAFYFTLPVAATGG